MIKRYIIFSLLVFLPGAFFATASASDGGRRAPKIDDLLAIRSLGGAQISPDGKWVAYTVTESDFKQDAYVTQIWIADVATGRTFHLTRNDKSSGNPQWSPDGRWLAFTSNRAGDKNQIFVISPEGGEAVQLSRSESAVAGYGEQFRKLNVRNLGVGDAWDVLSGVDHLIGKGWVDPAKVGCMGWSQGGYISAFLTASSDRFAAISVGAGISNWATYYYNTDITPFTINYLGDDPADDPEIYQKTSPMAYIKKARTPTLIQHGEFDRRVPIANAYELRQGLEDRGVKVEMVVYSCL